MTVPQPRPHQTDALLDLQRSLAVHDRTQLIMACGTGKTLVGRWHAQASDASLVLVLLPSLALVAQTLREWRRATGNRATGWGFQALVVCSDPTTTEGSEERAVNDDGIDISTRAWEQQQAQVTTDPRVAAGFLRAHQPGQRRVVFSTYHSAPVVAAAQIQATRGGDPVVFDLAICDEAHRLAGRPSPAFATILDTRKIVARKRVFMTATAKPFASDDGYSMDDPTVFGPVAHTVTFGEAITAGMLTDYQVLVIAGRRDSEVEGNTVPAVLAKAIDEHRISRVLTFHGRVAKAGAFAKALDNFTTPEGKTLRAKHVSGVMPTSDRSRTLEWLADTAKPTAEVRVVSNARCLSEGIDVPAVDGILFADQRSSIVDIIQAIGRVLRPSPGKKIGSIVLPVELDTDDDDTELALSAFSHVWAVLRGLRAHDQRLAEDIDELTRERAQFPERHHQGGWRVPRINFIIPDGIDLNELHLRAVNEVGSTWERNYGLMQAWAWRSNGKLIPRLTKVHTDTGVLVYLGEWCEQQRILRRRGVIDPTRASRLEEIPGWAWDKAEAWWANTYEILLAWAEAYGTVADNTTGPSVFKGMKNASYPRQDLGIWMAQQRQAYRLGTLTTDYIKLLEQLPGWAWDGGLPEVDVNHVEALRQFVEFEKHANVPDDHLEDGLRLGAWCWAVRRRALNKRLAPVLLDEIMAATPSKFLSDRRFQWEKDETQWRLKYFALRQFAEREGHTTATGQTKEKLPDATVNLGPWVAQQRFKRRHGDLDDRKAALLEALPGWQWEIEVTVVQAEPPVDLTGFATDHGQPGAYSRPHFCKCEVCLAAKRETARLHARNKAPRLIEPVPAEPARQHLAALEIGFQSKDKDGGHTRNGRTLISAVTGVALGQVRKVLDGSATEIERTHADALLALTLNDLLAARGETGSRGREISALTAKVDSGPTFKLLDDLNDRGFGLTWVGRELGYHQAPQLRRDGKVQARIANAIAELHASVGTRVMPPRPMQQRMPSLRELIAAEQQPAAA